ncbi:TIGR01777 family protein [Pedobacter polaris]|uniref:TIGR01777 family protein n=1 Tax=Pedobacter polaris TaxID=2571273 RepID=A0A4U1CW71_9SPHI|nr:TIGR01777 family oxidoreductase [Pedobacter polaris]TKC13214.1 TIGR01777 family protein [Pedobacter polaris]
MSKKILITGATGLVGRKLISALQALGHEIAILTRKQIAIDGVKVYLWDVYNQTMDVNALNGIDTVIHLAGEGIADKKWTDKRKKQIIDSRVLSAKLLYKTIQETKTQVKSFISASAVGYYGDRGDEILTENSNSGTGFLSECCMKWEDAANEGLVLGIRVVKIRIGLVLSKNDGALAAMAKPIKFFVGAPLGSGKQWMPWIHIDDIIQIFIKAVEDKEMAGAYNASAPFPVTNKLLTYRIAQRLNRPVWPIHVPKFALKSLMGEMCILPLMSNNTMVQKLLNTGYKFSYVNLDEALDSIYNK